MKESTKSWEAPLRTEGLRVILLKIGGQTIGPS